MSKFRKRHSLRNLALILGGLVLLEGNRRWAATFHTSSLEPTAVEGPNGRMTNGRRVVVRSVLDAAPDTVWALVKQPATLAKVVQPILGFKLPDGRPLPQVWPLKQTVSLDLVGFGLIPLGPHAITIHRFDEDEREAETHERGVLTPVWNHTLRVQPFGDAQTLYVDQVDLDAGPLNPLIGPFALFLFRYRHTRWKSLV